MARMTLFQMKYRNRMIVETGMIEATSLEMAEKLGRKWCDQDEKMRFVSVRDAILIREDVPQDQSTMQPQMQRKLG